MVQQGDEKPITRFDCSNCLKVGKLQTEVTNVHDFVKDVNRRQWWGITFAIMTLVSSIGGLMVIIFKVLPALAHASAAVVK